MIALIPWCTYKCIFKLCVLSAWYRARSLGKPRAFKVSDIVSACSIDWSFNLFIVPQLSLLLFGLNEQYYAYLSLTSELCAFFRRVACWCGGLLKVLVAWALSGGRGWQPICLVFSIFKLALCHFFSASKLLYVIFLIKFSNLNWNSNTYFVRDSIKEE